MLIYEVNVSVNEDRAREYAEFLDHHIRDILKFKGFKSAELLQELHPVTTSGSSVQKKVNYIVHYRVETEQDLQNYFDHHAAAMRQDAIQRFGNSFSAHRRNLICVKQFG